jgi:hypothetical protein
MANGTLLYTNTAAFDGDDTGILANTFPFQVPAKKERLPGTEAL